MCVRRRLKVEALKKAGAWCYSFVGPKFGSLAFLLEALKTCVVVLEAGCGLAFVSILVVFCGCLVPKVEDFEGVSSFGVCFWYLRIQVKSLRL